MVENQEGTATSSQVPSDNVDPIKLPNHSSMQFFQYSHLSPNLQRISKPFCDLAEVVNVYPDNAEKSACMRKLLEAKDCAVRANMFKDERPRSTSGAGEISTRPL